MNTDTTMQQLHDRVTRGEALSPEETARLAAWYARLDREETADLARALPAADTATLAAQVEIAVASLAAVTLRIQTLTAENAAVRQEIAALQRRLRSGVTTGERGASAPGCFKPSGG